MIDAMTTSSRCLAVLVGIVVAVLAFNPTVGSAATVTVTVGNGGPVFTPSSVTIQPGDTVRWTWSTNGHSSTSVLRAYPTDFGTPGFTARDLRSLTPSTPWGRFRILHAAWAMLRNDRHGDGDESDGASDRHN